MFSHILVGSNDIARSYLAYPRDPDGNKPVGLCRMPG